MGNDRPPGREGTRPAGSFRRAQRAARASGGDASVSSTGEITVTVPVQTTEGEVSEVTQRFERGEIPPQSREEIRQRIEGTGGLRGLQEFREGKRIIVTGAPGRELSEEVLRGRARVAGVAGLTPEALGAFVEKATPQEREAILTDVPGGVLGTGGTIRIGEGGARIFIPQELATPTPTPTPVIELSS